MRGSGEWGFTRIADQIRFPIPIGLTLAFVAAQLSCTGKNCCWGACRKAGRQSRAEQSRAEQDRAAQASNVQGVLKYTYSYGGRRCNFTVQNCTAVAGDVMNTCNATPKCSWFQAQKYRKSLPSGNYKSCRDAAACRFAGPYCQALLSATITYEGFPLLNGFLLFSQVSAP
jgi:hypothetical protein